MTGAWRGLYQKLPLLEERDSTEEAAKALHDCTGREEYLIVGMQRQNMLSDEQAQKCVACPLLRATAKRAAPKPTAAMAGTVIIENS